MPNPCCSSSTPTDIDLGIVNIESVERIEFEIQDDDGESWTGIDDVELTLFSPEGIASIPVAMTLVTPDVGVWYYDLLITDITETGRWRLSVKITEGANETIYPYEISLEAVSQGV